jgi:leucyl aminopeptidase
MKNLVSLLIITLGITSCAIKQVSLENISSKQTVETTYQLVSQLSSDKMEGRKPGTPGMESATQYIENYFHSINVPPFFDNYRDTLVVRGKESYNIVGLIKSKKPSNEYILIGAHLDHLGIRPSKTDSVYNGANDNASGVTAVLQISSILKEYRVNKNVIVAIFTGEESGLVGSKHLAKRLKEINTPLKLMINFEMIGTALSSGKEKVYVTGFDKSDLTEKINQILNKEFLTNLEGYDQLFFMSDNYPFFQEFGIPSHTISTFDFQNFDHFHKAGDEVDKLEIENMNSIVNLASLALLKLINEDIQINLKE